MKLDTFLLDLLDKTPLIRLDLSLSRPAQNARLRRCGLRGYVQCSDRSLRGYCFGCDMERMTCWVDLP
jgi:hypothetical protein